MVKGLQLNVYNDIMKGYAAAPGVKESVERLTSRLTAMKNAPIECADNSMIRPLKDANKIGDEIYK
jgi:hypothetical protein